LFCQPENLRKSVLLRQGYGEQSTEALAKVDALDVRLSALKNTFPILLKRRREGVF
jgi:hypothetical protein